MHSCPVCGNVQKLQKLKEIVRTPPQYFRMIVERSPERLKEDLDMIVSIAMQMEGMRIFGLKSSIPWNKERCVEPMFHRTCEYFNNHLNNLSTLEDQTMEEVEDYIGKVEN